MPPPPPHLGLILIGIGLNNGFEAQDVFFWFLLLVPGPPGPAW